MGRRHTAGVVGYQAVGGVQVDNTTFTAAENLDIVMDPSGTGLFKIAGDAQLETQGDLRFADADSSNYVAFQAPATVTSNVTWTLPSADGSANQAIVTNASGTLSFATVSTALTDNTVDASTNYLAFTTLTSGSLTAARVSSTKLTFQPSTGTVDVSGVVKSLRTENVQTGSYSLALTDRNIVVTMNNSGSATVTIPADSTTDFPIGSTLGITRIGSGTLTLAAAGGVTVNAGGTGNLALGETVECRKRAANTWIVFQRPHSVTGTGGSQATLGNINVHSYTSGTSTFVVGT